MGKQALVFHAELVHFFEVYQIKNYFQEAIFDALLSWHTKFKFPEDLQVRSEHLVEVFQSSYCTLKGIGTATYTIVREDFFAHFPHLFLFKMHFAQPRTYLNLDNVMECHNITNEESLKEFARKVVLNQHLYVKNFGKVKKKAFLEILKEKFPHIYEEISALQETKKFKENEEYFFILKKVRALGKVFKDAQGKCVKLEKEIKKKIDKCYQDCI